MNKVQNNPAVDTALRAQLTPVECAIWCDSGDGHTSATHMDDHVCISRRGRVDLTAQGMIITAAESMGFASLKTCLVREAFSTRTLLHLNHDEYKRVHQIKMTVEEARQHVNSLILLLANEQYQRTGNMPQAPDMGWDNIAEARS